MDRLGCAGDSGYEEKVVAVGEVLLFTLIAVAGFAVCKIAGTSRARAAERDWLPQELRHARLEFAEKTFQTWQPIRLIARADRGYRLDGEVRLVEFKTRKHAAAYPSDVLELSAQRLAIERSTGERVSEIGYVLVQDPHGNRKSARRVRLLSRQAVIAAARRREAILDGRVVPRYASSKGLCGHCVYHAECKPELLHRV